MKTPLLLAAAAAALFAASPAWADAVVVLGDGPERMCYVSAKTGLEPMNGLAHCDLALENGLVLHDRAATLVNRGVIEHSLGRVNAALDDFETCLRLIPDQPDALVNRGVARLTQNRPAEALADIQKGIDLGPSEPALAYYDRAIAYEALANGAKGDERQALLVNAYNDYQRAAKELPGFTAASRALARFRVTPRTGAPGAS